MAIWQRCYLRRKNYNVYLKKAAIQATIERTKFEQMVNVGGDVGDYVGG
ncbi:MAG: hypothetical protein IJK49_01385 [Prevotella sp.]|nr:hypothetical protein [Prevotella sp.]